MFEKHEIWERGKDMTTIYVVFLNLDTGLCHVQQANFVARAASMKDITETLATHNYYLLDLFSTQLPPETSAGFATITEAVEAHRREFADMGPLKGQ